MLSLLRRGSNSSLRFGEGDKLVPGETDRDKLRDEALGAGLKFKRTAIKYRFQNYKKLLKNLPISRTST